MKLLLATRNKKKLDELRRIHEIKPDAKLYLRIAAPNIGSD